MVNALTVSGRIFSADEHVENHCQVGIIKFALDLILDWIIHTAKIFKPHKDLLQVPYWDELLCDVEYFYVGYNFPRCKSLWKNACKKSLPALDMVQEGHVKNLFPRDG